jgi:Rrf2 family protein
MLSKKAKYGMKALLLLARESHRGPILIGELAEREGIPRKFLEAILLNLKHRGLVQSKKGHGGGYFLGRAADEISLGEIVRQLDGPLAAIPCVSQTAYQRCADCVTEHDCALRLAMKEVRDATAKILDGTSLLTANQRAARASHAVAAAPRVKRPRKVKRTSR